MDTPKQPETPTTSAAKETYKGTVSPQMDKVQSSVGTGKDFDALVQTLKFAIERGDIDKENVHRLAHGLGIKPETLASMVGVESKEAIEAEDQDDSPKNEVSPPDVQKDFKDFRSEIEAATSVTESMSMSDARKAARDLTTSQRRAGILTGSTSKQQQNDAALLAGRRTGAASQAGGDIASQYAAMLKTSQGRLLAKRLMQRGK
jgi:hypothetical protein